MGTISTLQKTKAEASINEKRARVKNLQRTSNERRFGHRVSLTFNVKDRFIKKVMMDGKSFAGHELLEAS